MDRNHVVLTLFAALLSNGRDPAGALEQAFKFGDMFLEAAGLKTDEKKPATRGKQPKKA